MRWKKCSYVLAAIASFASFWGTSVPVSASTDPLTSFNPGLYTVSGTDPIVFDAGGAHFGTGAPGDDGRTYLRTIVDNYAYVGSLVVEVTFETTSDDQQVFIGIGGGEKALFGTPDWSTLLSSASFWPETGNDKFTRFRTANDVNSFGDSTVAGFDPGIHRFRMTYTRSNGFLQGEIDVNYAGGPFVADASGSNFPIATASLRSPLGWYSATRDPSRIFIGGDDGAILRDLSITSVPEPSMAFLSLMGVLWVAGCRRFGA